MLIRVIRANKKVDAYFYTPTIFYKNTFIID